MKITKMSAVLSLAALLSTSAFAADGMSDKLYEASASAVENDSFYLMNILDWAKLSYEKGYGLVSLDSENYGNLAGATNLKNGAAIHGAWEGNLWEENAVNFFGGLYAWENKAVKGTFGKIDYTVPATPGNTQVKYVDGAFGMTYNSNWAFDAGAGYFWADVNDADVSIINLNAEAVYTFGEGSSSAKATRGKGKGKAETAKPATGFESTKAGLVLDVNMFDLDVISGNQITMTPYFKIQKQISEKLKYGFYFDTPVTVWTGDFDDVNTTMAFNMRNGIVAQVKPTFDFAGGIQTTFPTIVKDGKNGDFQNAFYMGCGIAVSPEVKIALCASIKPTEDDFEETDPSARNDNGVSLKEVWEQELSISVTIKM